MHLQTVAEKNKFRNNYQEAGKVILYLGFNMHTFLNSWI